MATQAQRHFIYEAIALGVVSIFGAFAFPELLNLHNSIAAVSAGMLFLAWIGWIAWFIIRVARKENS